jgi:hypothetical protein
MFGRNRVYMRDMATKFSASHYEKRLESRTKPTTLDVRSGQQLVSPWHNGESPDFLSKDGI